jgi:hypothetical protein
MVSILDAQRESKSSYLTWFLWHGTNENAVILTTIRQITHGDVRTLETLPPSQPDLTI